MILLKQAPVKPGYLVILTITIVIAKLGIAEFISGQEHWDSPAHHKNRKCILNHSMSQVIDLYIISLALITTVPAVIIIGSVSIIPAVSLIVFIIISIQIMKREAVMTGNKVNGSQVASGLRIINIRRTYDPVGGSLFHIGIALKEGSDIIPVSAVPLNPSVP